MTEAQPRAGGRFAPKARTEPEPTEQQEERAALPPIPTPVHDLFAEMAARRRASPEGFLIEPPVPLRMLNTIGQLRHGVAIIYNRQEITSKALIKHLEAWLRQIAKEGLPSDLDRAWQAFDPPLSGVKMQHRSLYDELRPACERRTGELYRARELEQRLLQARASLLQAAEVARQAIAEQEHHIAVEAPAELEKRHQRLAEIEAALWPAPETVAA